MELDIVTGLPNAQLPPALSRSRDTGPRDRYEKVAKLGEGTYGVVFKVKDYHMNAFVALKKVGRLERRGLGSRLRDLRHFAAPCGPFLMAPFKKFTPPPLCRSK